MLLFIQHTLFRSRIPTMSQGPTSKEKIEGDIQPTTSVLDGTLKNTIHDEVFGSITKEGPNYRAVCESQQYDAVGLTV